jgi:hypothetical protein
MAQLIGSASPVRAGTILLRGLDESLGNGPRRRTYGDMHAAEGRQMPLSQQLRKTFGLRSRC